MKTAEISGQERPGVWYVRRSQSGIVDNQRDGSELQAVMAGAVRQAGANALANKIDALTVVPATGYDNTALRRWRIESARRGTLIASVDIKQSNGDSKVTGDFERESFANLQDAVVWVVGQLGHPTLSDQIAAL